MILRHSARATAHIYVYPNLLQSIFTETETGTWEHKKEVRYCTLQKGSLNLFWENMFFVFLRMFLIVSSTFFFRFFYFLVKMSAHARDRVDKQQILWHLYQRLPLIIQKQGDNSCTVFPVLSLCCCANRFV